MKLGAEPTPRMFCMLNIPQTEDNIKHNYHAMIQPFCKLKENLGLLASEVVHPIV
jgi:hypothetical protein